eukprot:798998-Amphidinium_carterae.3
MESGFLCRRYPVTEASVQELTMVTDASPYGLGDLLLDPNAGVGSLSFSSSTTDLDQPGATLRVCVQGDSLGVCSAQHRPHRIVLTDIQPGHPDLASDRYVIVPMVRPSVRVCYIFLQIRTLNLADQCLKDTS